MPRQLDNDSIKNWPRPHVVFHLTPLSKRPSFPVSIFETAEDALAPAARSLSLDPAIEEAKLSSVNF
jgi:hypothetical protein